MQADGRVLMGGQFTRADGAPRNYAARVDATTPQRAPESPTAQAGDGQARVSWTAIPGAITSYTATANPGGRTCTTASATCTVTGLANGTSYSFTVAAANAFGSGPASPPTSSVTPDGTARLVASVLPSRTVVASGQSMRIGIRARNTGTKRALRVRSCVRVPAGMVMVAAKGSRRTTRTRCFAIGTLAAGAQATRTITVRAVATRPRTVRATGRVAGTNATAASARPVAVRITGRSSGLAVTG